MQIKLLLIVSLFFNFFEAPSLSDLENTLNKSSSDYLPYDVDVISTAFGSQDYVNIDARIVHAKDNYYAIDFLNQDWDMQVFNANDDYLGLPYFKSKIRRDITEIITNTNNNVEITEKTYLGLSSYFVKVHLTASSDSKMSDKWLKFIISKEGLLLRYETHSLSGGNADINKQREVVRFYIQEN